MSRTFQWCVISFFLGSFSSSIICGLMLQRQFPDADNLRESSGKKCEQRFFRVLPITHPVHPDSQLSKPLGRQRVSADAAHIISLHP
jgi:hypothetical protein